MAAWRNWARLERAEPVRVVEPASVDQVCAAAAARDGLRAKVVGASHSFNDIAAAPDVRLDLRRLTGILDADLATGRVTVAAGTRLFDLGPMLWDLGRAMPNLGDIDRQTIAGAISTSTHGTGATTPAGLSSQVVGLEIVLADATVTHAALGEPLFEAARVSLGAFGVITAVTLQTVPAFHLRSTERPLPLPEAVDRLIETDHGHPEFTWFPHTDTVLWKHGVAVAADTPPGPLPRPQQLLEDEVIANGLLGLLTGATARLPRTIRAVNGLAPRFFSDRTQVDRSYRVFASRRRVRFREGEFAVPIEALPIVLHEVQRWLDHPGHEVGFPMEVRTGPAEEPWLAMAYGRRTAFVSAQTHRHQDHRPFVGAVQAIVAEHQGRPHWGKLHTLDAERLRPLYPRFDKILSIRDQVDPERTFANAHLDRVLGP